MGKENQRWMDKGDEGEWGRGGRGEGEGERGRGGKEGEGGEWGGGESPVMKTNEISCRPIVSTIYFPNLWTTSKEARSMALLTTGGTLPHCFSGVNKILKSTLPPPLKYRQLKENLIVGLGYI